MSNKIPVSIQRCHNYDPDEVRDALNNVLDPLGGMRAFVTKGDRVLLKPNLLAPKPPGAAVTTHPEVVRAAALTVMEAGGEVFLGDSPGVGSLSGVLKRTGIMPVVQELGIEIVPFRSPVPVPVPEGGVSRSFLLAEEATGYDLILNLPKFKTHGMMTLTLAVKNMFGTVVGAAKPGWHLQAGDTVRFADMLLDIWSALPPGLSVMDGITAMEGNGPGSGDPLALGILMASPSALAMDCVAGSVAGLPVERHPVLYQARARGLEGARSDQVQVLGKAIEDVRRVLRLPRSASRVDYRLPGWMKRSMRKSLNPFPLLNPELCTSCGACAAICPADAITLNNKPRTGGLVDKDKCISCFCCQEVCPERAIEIVPGRLLRVLKRINFA
ncbi:MAG: DUF362 domain-containing protein [bacterium]|nr:DUF362 domain-containing protein [bacterium]MDT8365810.1 DUF362 domain-containing protein [bacterium]